MKTKTEALIVLFGIAILVNLVILVYIALSLKTYSEPQDEAGDIEIISEPVYVQEVNNVTQVISEEKERHVLYALSEQDKDALMRMAWSEARGEGAFGQALVMKVIMNRVASSEFPDTVVEVVEQKGQFSPYADGTYAEATPNWDTELALNMLLGGELEYMQSATYFCTRAASTKWHATSLNELFQYKGHVFYAS